MIELKKVSLKETIFYNELRNNIENYALLNYGTFQIENLNDTKKWIGNNKKKILSIYYKKNLIGYIKIVVFSPGEAFRNHKEVGIFINKKYRGLGIGKKSLKKVLRLDKRNKYIARVSESNTGSKNLFKSVGFRILGKMNVFRKATKKNENLILFVLDSR